MVLTCFPWVLYLPYELPSRWLSIQLGGEVPQPSHLGRDHRSEHVNRPVGTLLGCAPAPSCLTPCDLWTVAPNSFVRGVLQARIQEWVSISSSRESSQPRDRTTSPVSPALQADSLLLSHQGSTREKPEVWTDPPLLSAFSSPI